MITMQMFRQKKCGNNWKREQIQLQKTEARRIIDFVYKILFCTPSTDCSI